MNYIDLHTHTTASDGTYTPSALVDYAIEKKLKAIAITDHDTIEGVIEAKNYLGDKNIIEIISGVEFSTNSPNVKNDIHILGLYINENNSEFVSHLDQLISSRNLRNKKMLDKLCDIGFPMTLKEVEENATDGVITRAHFAKAMLKKGYIDNIRDAFTKYIGNDCIANVPREKLAPQTAMRMILECNGVPVLAHPTLYKLNLRELDTLIEELVSYGLLGIEGIYPLYTKAETKYIHDFAKQYNLIITGGSDFHGSNKPGNDLGVGYGKLKVPYSLLNPIKNYTSNYK